MKPFLFVLVLIGAGIVGLGFYQGWFSIGSDSGAGKSNVRLSVDTDKFQEDRKAVVTGVQNLGRKTEDQAPAKSHVGKVVSITSAQLVMTNMAGAEEHQHALTADARITCDGKACQATDLKNGMRVRVTTEHAAPHKVTRIEALGSNPDFEKDA